MESKQIKPEIDVLTRSDQAVLELTVNYTAISINLRMIDSAVSPAQLSQFENGQLNIFQ